MNRKRDVLKRHAGPSGHLSRALLSTGALLVGACSLQDLEYLGEQYGRDGGLSGSLNMSGAGGNAGRGGSGSSNGGNGGSGSGGASGEGGGGSAGTGGSGSGGSGGGGAGGSSGTAPINYGGSAGQLLNRTLPDGGPDGNLIPDPGFEDGITGWTPVGNPVLTWTTEGPAAGARCLRASGRTYIWEGPSFSLLGAVTPGETYSVSLYTRLSHARSMKFTIKHFCEGVVAPVFTDISTFEGATSWRLFEGTFTVPTTCTLTDYRIFAEQAPVNVDIFLDEVQILLVE